MKVLRSSPLGQLKRELMAAGVPQGTGRSEDFDRALQVMNRWKAKQVNLRMGDGRLVGFIADWVGVL